MNLSLASRSKNSTYCPAKDQFSSIWREAEGGQNHRLDVNLNGLSADRVAMQKEDMTILIVDDDATMGKAMKEAVTRAGYKAIHVTRPDDAIATLKLQPVQAAVIDCMLPKMNGRDLAKKLKDDSGGELPTILVSGVYKDKNFAREAILQTGAMAFLTKPIDLNDLMSQIDTKLGSQIDNPIPPLQSLLAKHELSHKERVKAVNDAGEIHGFDLPWIFSILMHPRISGHLNIISADGEVCGVGFQKGSIVQVNQKDAKSYFGVLMVEYGFITQAEIEEVMKSQGKTKKMGERLVEANLLSPHAIQIIMAEQQGIRLSRVIAETSMKVNFIESDELREDAVVEKAAITELLNDWLMSKITVDWLRSYYIPWMRFSLRKGADYSDTHRCFSLPVVMRVPKIAEKLMGAASLEQALADLDAPEGHIYSAMHALLLCRVLQFGEQKNSVDFEAQRKRLVKLNADLQNQTLFERLGVSAKAKDSEIKRAYHEIAKILHPDKVSSNAPTEVRELAKSAFSMINEAHETLSNSLTKEQYLVEMEKGRAEAILQAEQHIEQARGLLTKGDATKALDLLDKAVKLAPPTAETRLLRMWARLKQSGADKNPQIVAAVRDEIGAIPPEDRHNPIYYFVKGLHLRVSGDHENARKTLEHAVSIAPDFIDAKRELSRLKADHSNKPVDLLRGDLKDVVGLLFKKKR
jgi:CheY-like chemotaxis protein